jgi:actin-related protein 5
MAKIKERKRRKAALGDRKSAAAQSRMKTIATLAADDRVPKKKRKVGGGMECLSYLQDVILNGTRGYVRSR